MGRPRVYDRDAAIRAAMQVFWTKGYARASLSDLEAAMGMSRAAIYAAFGDKQALFLKALDLYDAQLHEGKIGNLRHATDPKAALQAHFEDLAATVIGTVGPGCMLTNTSIEQTGRDADIAEGLTKGLLLIEEVFSELIAKGQDMGQFTKTRSARSLARHMVNTAQGIRVLSRNPDLEPWMTDVLDTAFSVLEPLPDEHVQT